MVRTRVRTCEGCYSRTLSMSFVARLVACGIFILFSATLHTSTCCAQNQPYVAQVLEYRPAPGQFVNIYPAYEDGNTEADMLAKVETLVVNRVGSNNYVCLGAWGGYITFRFDHPLVNVPGEADLKIYGNALVSNMPSEDEYTYGSMEPGIIYVSRDDNADGLPNDTWYEIAGSESARTRRQYSVTYYNDQGNVPYEDCDGNVDYIYRNTFHMQQSYCPLWLDDDEWTFTGSLLPKNINPTTYESYMYPDGYGYSDMWRNDDERSNIQLDWAIDAAGQPAHLDYVHFVRVQTGTLINKWGPSGLSGEMSTEFCGAEDLHPDEPLPMSIGSLTQEHEARKVLINHEIHIVVDGQHYSVLGTKLTNNK